MAKLTAMQRLDHILWLTFDRAFPPADPADKAAVAARLLEIDRFVEAAKADFAERTAVAAAPTAKSPAAPAAIDLATVEPAGRA